MRNVRLTDGQASKFFVYVANLLKDDTLLIYKTDEKKVYLTRLGSHAQLFNM